MLRFGREFAKTLPIPAVIELVGDVGVGKTTFVRGLAEGLGIKEPVTSPSFTISKRYAFRPSSHPTLSSSAAELVHYDFYRLSDPGIMQEELAEVLSRPDTVAIIEWGTEVASLLPANKIRLTLNLTPDGSRVVELTGATT